jgi:hypothetical protein
MVVLEIGVPMVDFPVNGAWPQKGIGDQPMNEKRFPGSIARVQDDVSSLLALAPACPTDH